MGQEIAPSEGPERGLPPIWSLFLERHQHHPKTSTWIHDSTQSTPSSSYFVMWCRSGESHTRPPPSLSLALRYPSADTTLTPMISEAALHASPSRHAATVPRLAATARPAQSASASALRAWAKT